MKQLLVHVKYVIYLHIQLLHQVISLKAISKDKRIL